MRAVIPTPEPGPLTAMLTPGFFFMNSSAQTELMGVTVFDPMIFIEPDRPSPPVLGAQPAMIAIKPIASTTVSEISNFVILFFEINYNLLRIDLFVIVSFTGGLRELLRNVIAVL
jgi:hypothetical protein